MHISECRWLAQMSGGQQAAGEEPAKASGVSPSLAGGASPLPFSLSDPLCLFCSIFFLFSYFSFLHYSQRLRLNLNFIFLICERFQVHRHLFKHWSHYIFSTIWTSVPIFSFFLPLSDLLCLFCFILLPLFYLFHFLALFDLPCPLLYLVSNPGKMSFLTLFQKILLWKLCRKSSYVLSWAFVVSVRFEWSRLEIGVL